jgi:hypothetical protein
MFIIHKQSDTQYTVECHIWVENTGERHTLYTVKNLVLADAAQFMLGRGDEDVDRDIESLFTLTNITKAYVSDTGRISAVAPL